MAKTLTVDFEVRARFAYEKDDELHDDAGSFTFSFSDSLASGTESDQSDLLWADRRTLSAASENIDLAGVLMDNYGDTLTFVEVTGIIIRNRETADGKVLKIGGAAANTFVNWVANATDILQIGPGAILALFEPKDGYTVTAGTGDQLKIDAGSRIITYDIIIFGRSAAGS